MGPSQQAAAPAAAVRTPGWLLLEGIKSADSIVQLIDLTPKQMSHALRFADILVSIPTTAQDSTVVSWGGHFHQQLQLLFGATANVLRLYPQTDTVDAALKVAPTIRVLLVRVTELVHVVNCQCHTVDIAKALTAYRQRQPLPAAAMAALQLLEVLDPLGEPLCVCRVCIASRARGLSFGRHQLLA